MKVINPFLSRNPEPTTFIGGIGGVVDTVEKLTQYINLPVRYIKNFLINENLDISFYMGRKYTLQGDHIPLPEETTYIIDLGKLEKVGQGAIKNNMAAHLLLRSVSTGSPGGFGGFNNLPELVRAYLPNLVNEGGGATNSFFNGTPNLKSLYIPRLKGLILQNIGRNMLRNLSSLERIDISSVTEISYIPEFGIRIFENVREGAVLILNPAMLETDPTIDYCKNERNCVIRYKTNNIPPSPITDLTITPTTTTATFNFTTPTGSVNAIDFYEVWIEERDTFNPVQKYLPNDIELTATGQTVTGLKPNTWYVAKLATCDIFYNGSGMSDTPSFSNEITFKTL